MKKLMVLGASILQLPAIQCAKSMGVQVIAVDMNPDAIGFKEPGIQREIISTIDIPAVVAAAKKHQIDGVMTLASDMPMRTVAAVSKELGLVGVSEETAFKATNKAAMREALKQGGVPIPAFCKVSSTEEYLMAVKNFCGPFVVKPADNSGSRGIVLVEDLANDRLVAEAYAYSHKYSRNGDVVVEEYMQGKEVSVETLTVDGECHVIQITDKITTGAPHFVEMGHSQPTMQSPEIVKKIEAVAKAANRAIGISNGPSHTEIMVTEDGPKIVELGARLGGDCITSHLVPLSTGVDMVECCIRIALGETPNFTKRLNRGAAIRYFRQRKGRIASIEGLIEAEKLPGVHQISVIHNVGEIVDDVDSSAARMGFVIAQGENAVQAIKNCENAVSHIQVRFE